MTVIALIDGPLSKGLRVGRQTLHCALHPHFGESPAAQHAHAMAATILSHAPWVEISNHVVFPGKLSTSVAAICDALEQALRPEVTFVHCSFGLPYSTPGLLRAISALTAAGKYVVASAAARGGQVYPAAFDGVTSVQGDARCMRADWSFLNLPHADFGACPIGKDTRISGASVAAAHFTGLWAREMRNGRGDKMASHARFKGRERITSREGPKHDGV